LIGPLRSVVLRSVAAVLALLTLSAAPAHADAVNGPVGPELSCVNPLLTPGIGVILCRLDRFAPGTPVVITIPGRRGEVARVRPGDDGRAGFRFRWPFARSGYHTIVATQGRGSTALRSSTTASVFFEVPTGMSERGQAADDRSADLARRRSREESIAVPPAPESQVPLRVTASIGLVAVGMIVLFVRHRRRRQFGL